VYFGAHGSIGCKGITLFGTEAQKQRWLPKCATGEIVAAFCLTEPGSGSDAQAMASTAIPSEDGTFYVLNGTKMWISNAGYAGVFTVFAKVPRVVDGKSKPAVTAFIVDAHSDGIQLGQPEHKLGIKASDTRVVTFENVRVPVANVLGEVGHGFRIALEILNSGRLGLATASARGARNIMNVAIEHAKQRHQFGRPIGSFEMIQHKIARASANVYAADSATMVTAGMVDRGGIDFSLETAICKVFASEVAVEVTSDAMQIAGGIGYSQEFPYEQAMRDARINMIFEGTNEILRALVALSGLQQPGERLREMGTAFKDPLHSLGAIGSFLADYAKRTVKKPEFHGVHDVLNKHAGRVARLIHDFSLAVDRTLVTHGKKIIEKQFLQERMANVAIDIYVSVAVLARTTWELERLGGPANAQVELECAKAFLNDAYRRARRNIKQLHKHQDARLKALAEHALERSDAAPAMPWEYR
jgi:acyl-CoA dehydrogenase family protein 9